jgi:flavin reductase (DIM6/NTAB) family NADH-FMN oxidoreductase RutF
MSQDTETLTAEFRNSMSRLAAGVTVVAAAADGQLHGMAATSTSSVSIDPPTILVCLEKSSRTFQLVEASQRMCVSILTAEQADVLDVFAGRHDGENNGDRFRDLDYRMTEHGTPLIEDSIAWLDCEVVDIFPGGNSHGIVVARVIEVQHDEPDARPMVWYGRSHGTFQEV